MTNNNFIVVNIGCIESGVSTNIVGVFSTEEEANRVVDLCHSKYDWRQGGQNDFEVFPIPDVGVIDEEYNLSEILGDDT